MTTSDELARYLPFLRRYARALTGTQITGDAYVRVVLQSLVDGDVALTDGASRRVALYRLFHRFWSAGGRLPEAANTPSARSGVEDRLQALLPESREALLLTAVEGFSTVETAMILGCSTDDVEDSVAAAMQAIDRNLESRVLIVEDETIIALDLEYLVKELGHRVAGVAATRDGAVRMARECKPDLILTDIKLADGSSGVDAAMAILKEIDVPVVFVTAYPECLLTGQRPEPVYLVAKPFSRDTVRATIGQALFFHQPRMAA
jgi:CheY-like chemotaxis protein